MNSIEQSNIVRNLSFDYLKFIGMIGLLIAHISSNKIILSIRSFDVNLLIILSAILATDTVHSDMTLCEIRTYIKKRILRLAVPTWIFITIYLLLNLVFRFADYNIVNIVRSYLFQDNSISYVWIIYVYLIVAAMMPFIVRVDLINSRNNKLIFCLCVLCYIFLYMISDDYYYRVIVLYPIVYGMISAFAINWNGFSAKYKRIFLCACTALFLCLAVFYYYRTGMMLSIDAFKYPPKLYYLTYTLAVSFALLEIFQKIKMGGIVTYYITFVCRHSLWFYLWHILMLQISYRISDNEWIRFLTVIVGSSLIIFAQETLVNKLADLGFNKKLLSIFKG